MQWKHSLRHRSSQRPFTTHLPACGLALHHLSCHRDEQPALFQPLRESLNQRCALRCRDQNTSTTRSTRALAPVNWWRAKKIRKDKSACPACCGCQCCSCARNVPCIPLCYPHHTANPPLISGELSRVNHEGHQPLPTFAVAWRALQDASEWVKDILLNGYKQCPQFICKTLSC